VTPAADTTSGKDPTVTSGGAGDVVLDSSAVEIVAGGKTTVQAAAGPYRKIIHVDIDAFYASVEQWGKPVAVGGSATRGVVAAAGYEARAFGVRSALPSITANRKCPELIFVPPRFDVYRAVSAQIREIFAEHTDLIEPLSLDEAYLDVAENIRTSPSPRRSPDAAKSRGAAGA